MAAVHPHFLSGGKFEDAKTIERDQQCANCQYNVRGLTIGQNCPECGCTIRPLGFLFEEDMKMLPLRTTGCITVGAVLATLPLPCLWGLISASQMPSGPRMMAMYVCALIVIVGTFWATLTVNTVRAKAFRLGPAAHLRMLVRIVSVGFLGIPLIDTSGQASALGVSWATAWLSSFMLLFQALLTYHLARVGEWSGNRRASNLLIWCGIFSMMALFPALLAAIWFSLPLVCCVVAILASLMCAVFSLARSMGYAVATRGEYQARNERRERRRQAYNEQLAARTRQVKMQDHD